MKNWIWLAVGTVATSSSIAGGLERSVPRGDDLITISTPLRGPDEICGVPKHLPGADYRCKDGANDRENERELCTYSPHQAGPTARNGGVATCPKVSSTSAAIEFQEI